MANLASLKKRIAQYEATTGRKVSSSLLQAWAREEIASEQDRATQERTLSLGEERLKKETALTERALAGQESAAKTSGLVQLGSAGVQTGMLLKGTDTGKALASGVKSALGIETAVTPGSIAAATAAPGAVAQTAVGKGIGAIVGEGIPGAVAPAGEAVISGTAAAPSMLNFGALMTPMGIGGMAVSMLGEKIGMAPRAAGAVGGAMTGFAVGGPIGALIGGTIGAISGGTVICTELHRQGYLPGEILELSSQHRVKHIDDHTYAGYMKWAPKVVSAMQKSFIMTEIVKPFGMSWAYEMASRMDPAVKGNLTGKILMKIGVPVCRKIGQLEAAKWAFLRT